MVHGTEKRINNMVTLCDGKYVFHTEGGPRSTLHCKRYGEEWRNFCGDNAVRALYERCMELERLVKQYECVTKFLDVSLSCRDRIVPECEGCPKATEWEDKV